jgi:hypothetical protein
MLIFEDMGVQSCHICKIYEKKMHFLLHSAHFDPIYLQKYA